MESGSIRLIFPTPDTKETVFSLISKIKPKAQQIHDIFLAATLLSNGVKALITENIKDFSDIRDLEVVNLNDGEF